MRLIFHEPPVQKWYFILYCSVVQSFTTLCDTMDCSMSLSFTISQSLLNFMSIELVMSSNRLILCCPLLLRSSIFHSIRVFSNELVLHIRWPKYWSFSFSTSLSNEYSGLTGLICLLSKRLLRVFSNITAQKHQFFSAQLSLWFNF